MLTKKPKIWKNKSTDGKMSNRHCVAQSRYNFFNSLLNFEHLPSASFPDFLLTISFISAAADCLAAAEIFPAFSAVYSSLNGSGAAEDFRYRWGLVSGDFSGHCHVYCNFSNARRAYLGNAAPHVGAAVCQWLTNVAGMQLRSLWRRILRWRWTCDVVVAAWNRRIPNTLSLLTLRLTVWRFAF